MIDIKDLPAPWLAILTAVREVAPEAVLAGGALRDLDNGAPVKDLDIFIEHKLTHGLPGFGLLAKLQQIDPFAYRMGVSDFSSCALDADCILSETFRVSGLEVNIIHLDGAVNPNRVVDRIDFGICQIGITPHKVYWTPAYEADKAWKRFTIVRRDSVDDNARTLRRWDRISQKYPGWTLVNPWGTA